MSKLMNILKRFDDYRQFTSPNWTGEEVELYLDTCWYDFLHFEFREEIRLVNFEFEPIKYSNSNTEWYSFQFNGNIYVIFKADGLYRHHTSEFYRFIYEYELL